MKTDLKCWPVPLIKHCSCTVVEALLTFTDINGCTQMTHYKCSINPRSNTLQLTANTFALFLCYLAGVRHMFAQYYGQC